MNISAKASGHKTVSVWNTIQSQTFSMTTPACFMSFVQTKFTAHPSAIPMCVICSVWVQVWARHRKA